MTRQEEVARESRQKVIGGKGLVSRSELSTAHVGAIFPTRLPCTAGLVLEAALRLPSVLAVTALCVSAPISLLPRDGRVSHARSSALTILNMNTG